MKTTKFTRILAATALVGGAAVATGAAVAASGEGHQTRVMKMFERLDANGDGAVEKSEVRAAAANRFAAADANGDGRLTRDELVASGHRKAEKRADKMLKRLDADGDGAISAAELEGHGGKHEKRAEKMFDRLDADGDGRITKAEAEDAAANWRGKHGRKHRGEVKPETE